MTAWSNDAFRDGAKTRTNEAGKADGTTGTSLPMVASDDHDACAGLDHARLQLKGRFSQRRDKGRGVGEVGQVGR